MKYTFFILCAALLCGPLFSQHPAAVAVPAQLSAQLDAEELAATLEAKTLESYVPVHAIHYDVHYDESDALYKDGSFFWKISCPNMAARVFWHLEDLPRGDTLFFWGKSGEREIFTADNFYQKKNASEPIAEEVLVEYRSHSGLTPDFEIQNYSLEIAKKTGDGFGCAGPCEVNVNCDEGNQVRDQVGSVVRILTVNGGFQAWCTGTLVANTLYDDTPYIITAEHCALMNGTNVQNDYSSWIFYFNYESPDCNNPQSEGDLARDKTAGANLVAHSADRGGDFGSDFLLLKLDIDESKLRGFNPYFAGWKRYPEVATALAPQSGHCLHHPVGDIKKVSTFTRSATSGEFFPDSVLNTHWLVQWARTANGFGVTEGGSSGSPLFDEEGLFRGQLTGGSASCSNAIDGIDYYGKFTYSWDQNGNRSDRGLANWLDPSRCGRLALPGYKAGQNPSTICKDTNTVEIRSTIVSDGVLKLAGLANFSDTRTASIDIISTAGQRVMFLDTFVPFINQTKDLDVSKLRNGIYYVRVISDEKIEVFKILIP